MRKHLIDAGVRNIKEFGYPNCNADNILKDAVYSAFFRKMLEETYETSKTLRGAARQLEVQSAVRETPEVSAD